MPDPAPCNVGCQNAKWMQNLRIKWVHCRHSWRLTLFYYSYSSVCCIGILLTFILHILTSVNSFFFVNFRCGSRTQMFVRANFVAMMIMASAIALLGLLTLRIIKLFISHTLSEFKPTGSWMGRIGCLVKWLPWCMAIFTIAMIGSSFATVLWIVADPYSWCSRRWSTLALQAVKNCRLWFGGTAACLKTVLYNVGWSSCKACATCSLQTIARKSNLHGVEPLNVLSTASADHAELPDNLAKCNDGEFLQSTFFFYFIPKSSPGTCTFLEPAVCLLYKNSYSTLAVDVTADWTSGSAVECQGLESKDKPIEDFMDSSNSDLYKYLLIYAMAWCTAMICIIFLFFYVKYTSHFEGYFCQPPSQTKHLLLLPFRPFTPWGY